MGVVTWTDKEMLTVLDLIDEFGLTAAQVADRDGVTRNAIIGIRNRVLSDLRKSEAAPGPVAQKPENRDGGMVQGWWRAGLSARVVA